MVPDLRICGSRVNDFFPVSEARSAQKRLWNYHVQNQLHQGSFDCDIHGVFARGRPCTSNFYGFLPIRHSSFPDADQLPLISSLTVTPHLGPEKKSINYRIGRTLHISSNEWNIVVASVALDRHCQTRKRIDRRLGITCW